MCDCVYSKEEGLSERELLCKSGDETNNQPAVHLLPKRTKSHLISQWMQKCELMDLRHISGLTPLAWQLLGEPFLFHFENEMASGNFNSCLAPFKTEQSHRFHPINGCIWFTEWETDWRRNTQVHQVSHLLSPGVCTSWVIFPEAEASSCSSFLLSSLCDVDPQCPFL